MYIWLSFASRGPMMKKAGGGAPLKLDPGASNPPPLPDPGAAVGIASADMARLEPGCRGEKLRDGTSLDKLSKVLTGELPDQMSCHIEIRSGGPIISICGDRRAFCILFPDDGEVPGRPFRGC